MNLKPKVAAQLRRIAKRIDPEGEPKSNLYVFDSAEFRERMEQAEFRLNDPNTDLMGRIVAARELFVGPVMSDIHKIGGSIT